MPTSPQTQGYATGGVDYIATPIVPEILRAKVRVFVELFRMRQQVAHQAEDQARREAAEEAARRSTFLADASRALSTSLDFEATLKTLARIPIPHLADTSLVCLTNEQGRITRCEISWTDPIEGCALPLVEGCGQVQTWLEELATGVLSATRTHSHVRLPAPAEPMRAEASGGTHPSPLPPPVQSVLVLPLIARTRVFGTLMLLRRAEAQPFVPKDITLAQELSGRAAIALDNAMLVRDIQEADRHKNEFLAMLAHELRNPLAPIKNAVELLRMQGLKPDDLAWAQPDRASSDPFSSTRRRSARRLAVTRGKIRLEMRVRTRPTSLPARSKRAGR